jgi:hypothetical protein
MMGMGGLAPTKVVRIALHNAAAIAGLMITTQANDRRASQSAGTRHRPANGNAPARWVARNGIRVRRRLECCSLTCCAVFRSAAYLSACLEVSMTSQECTYTAPI